jgi:hypothetical protein
VNRRRRDFYIDNQPIILGTLIAVALLAVLSLAIYFWRTDFRGLVYDETTKKLDLSGLGKLFAGLATIAGGIFALWRWTVDQRWRRIQYAQQLLEKFFAKENTKLALRMLDVQGRTELPIETAEDDTSDVDLTEQMLIGSLQTLDQRKRFDEPYFTIRMIFDEFFTDLSMFQHHIDAGLIKLKDIRPYLEYWIKSINGYGQIYTIALARQINAFLESFDYSAVLKLSKVMGYSLKTK